MAEIKDLSTTDASNNGTAANAGFPEAMPPSDVNNAARALEGMIARIYADTNGTLATTGSANAYLLAPNRTISAVAAGDAFLVKANHANTGAATLNVSSLGAKAIVLPSGAALAGGEIQADGIYLVAYDGTSFQLLGGSSGSLDYLGDARATAVSTGLDVFGTIFDVDNSAAATPTFIRLRNSEGGISVAVDGGNATIYQTDSTGAAQDAWIAATQNGGVALYYNNEVREVTTSQGVTVTGASTGNVIARVESEGVYDPALQLSGATYGARAYMDDTAGRFYLRQTAPSGTLEDIWMFGDVNGATSLYYNGAQKLATTTGGAQITGTLNATTSLTANGVAALLVGGELNDLANATKNLSDPGYYTFPGGFTVQWGQIALSGATPGSDTFVTPFTTLLGVAVLPYATTTSQDGSMLFCTAKSTTGLTFLNRSGATSLTAMWIAVGYKA